MKDLRESRRQFLKATGLAAGTVLLSPKESLAQMAAAMPQRESKAAQNESGSATTRCAYRTLPSRSRPNESFR